MAAGFVAHLANGAQLWQQKTRRCESAELPDGKRGVVTDRRVSGEGEREREA